MSRPHVIVLGNEKGGCGKSTTAMHLIMNLQREGYRVASMDLDARQRTLTRYFENRRRFAEEKNVRLLPNPHVVLPKSDLPTVKEMEADETRRFMKAYEELSKDADILVIDCPGSDSFLSRLAHSWADTIITPVNDSFVDVDLLAKVNPNTHEVEQLSLYSEMVWKSRQARATRDKGQIDWIVLRNRVSGIDARNKRYVEGVLEKLAKRVGFRFVAGFGERVIYRELFLKGLTLVDLKKTSGLGGKGLSMSEVAARQELRRLMECLRLPSLESLAQAS